jgi:hypothetical protein
MRIRPHPVGSRLHERFAQIGLSPFGGNVFLRGRNMNLKSIQLKIKTNKAHIKFLQSEIKELEEIKREISKLYLKGENK